MINGFPLSKLFHTYIDIVRSFRPSGRDSHIDHHTPNVSVYTDCWQNIYIDTWYILALEKNKMDKALPIKMFELY